MAPSVQLKLTGDKELIAALNKLPEAINRKVTAAAIRAGAQPILKAVQGNVASGHVVSGNLLKSLRVKSKWYKAEGIFAAYIGGRWGKGGGAHLHLLEEGHQQVAGGKLSGGGRVIGQVSGYPVLAPAFDAKAGAARQRIESHFRTGVAREAKKLPKGRAQ